LKTASTILQHACACAWDFAATTKCSELYRGRGEGCGSWEKYVGIGELIRSDICLLHSVKQYQRFVRKRVSSVSCNY
ncbi:hypothetical protein KI387_000814, partial [Taxus chinensis]